MTDQYEDDTADQWAEWFGGACESLPEVATAHDLVVVMVTLADVYGIPYSEFVEPLEFHLKMPQIGNETIH